MRNKLICLSSAFVFQSLLVAAEGNSWSVKSQVDWEKVIESIEGAVIEEGQIKPLGKTATVSSKLQTFDKKVSVKKITIKQSPIWQNWQPVENIGPINLGDAPVMLQMDKGNYWMFGRYSGGKQKKGAKNQANQAFQAADAKLDGFDMPLKTTPYENQFDAPGGLEKKLGGYHAWQSKDMVNWVHHGPVSEGFSKWVTTAEQVDGKLYLYYDFPNDQDPHLYIDDDLFDGKPGKNVGLAFKDPSHGSDCAIIRDTSGTFNLIYEDWSPINASKRAWDSPLAGRATSKKGHGDFEIQAPAVDYRTKPTGEKKTYNHPHWKKEDPKNFPSNVAEYEVHEPEQNAYGDWAAITIGDQHYLFADYDSPGSHKMSVAWFTSSSLDEKFSFCDNIGEGHPDPDIMFAEGKFYLATQQKTDYVSPGPWVETVEVRVGVDTNKDGKINQWTEWQPVKESYDYIEGFSKRVKRTPAALDLKELPEGFGFKFELRMTDTTENKSTPIVDSVEVGID